MNYLIIIILGYLIGSIPFALIVGKVFYNTDIRQHGSGNLGGTNAGRTLGKKAGIAVMVLDVLKAAFAILLATLIINQFNLEVSPVYAGIAAVFGHCFPIFAGFKGGKGVATMAGFVLAVNGWLFLLAILILLINLKIHKMVSLGAIVTIISLVIVVMIVPSFNYLTVPFIVMGLLVIERHKENIKRIKNKEERKVTWI